MLTTLRLGGQCSGDNYESGTLIVIGKIRSVKHLSYSPSPPRRPATPWSYMASQHLYGQVPSVWSQVCPKIFNAVVDFLAWILFCNGIQFVLHYLDDFLVIFPPGSALAAGMRSQVEAIFDYARLQEILSCWRDRKRCTKDLQILLGHLSHAAIVIRQGQIFLSTLFSLVLFGGSLPLHSSEPRGQDRHCLVAMPVATLERPVLSFPQQTFHSTFTQTLQGHLVVERTAQSCHYGSNYHGLSHGLQLA